MRNVQIRNLVVLEIFRRLLVRGDVFARYFAWLSRGFSMASPSFSLANKKWATNRTCENGCSFFLQLEVSCLQLSFFAYNSVLELFTYN